METEMTDLKRCAVGIELGSTRIKAVLADGAHRVLASGEYEWENKLENGIWTYSLEDVRVGLQTCFARLKEAVRARCGVPLAAPGAIGVSGMMHGYLPFDREGRQLAAFRTWRNTVTGEAAAELTGLFGFNIPQRWSIAHLWQAMRGGEEHVRDIARLTTLSGYVHYRLTGRHAVGVGEASGMFPVDSASLDYDARMMEKFDALAAGRGYPLRLRGILPQVLAAGENAGFLTEEGAAFLDPAGDLLPGVPLCPCEGDAGTGMVATDSVRAYTGNVSAGTSDFAMIVTDRPLGVHREIDMVTTPAGLPVAMVHCNNCTSDLNAWVGLFSEFAEAIGAPVPRGRLFSLLFRKALEGAADGGGLLSYNYESGEGVTDLDSGRPLFLRRPGSRLTLPDFMRTHLMSALATLKIGMDLLTRAEGVRIDRLCAHGGFFKTPEAGQRILSAAVGVPVSVMETAGEGGPYGMALLASFLLQRREGESLEDYLDRSVFSSAKVTTLTAEPEEIAGFAAYLERYKKALPAERTATEVL